MTEYSKNRGIVRTLIDNSFLLIAGAVAALVWANLAHQTGSESYNNVFHSDLTAFWSDHGAPEHQAHSEPEHLAAEAPAEHGEGGEDHHADEEHAGHHGLTLHFIINDILMALFFAIAAKEVWESLLPGGALSNPRKAATPLLATVGGILGPALVYIGGAFLTGTHDSLGNGWAIPCATDIAFSYLIARFIFGAGHPAIAFLLLLAIADDAAGLMILAVFYPQAPIVPQWLLLTIGAMLGAMLLRRMKVQSHWAYIAGPGALCWYSFFQAHIHPALGLVPIIPLLPHAHSDLGFFAREELERDDTLNEFEHFWKTPVEVFLGLFGLANAGVVLSSLGAGTWLVLAGLLVGKPVGITLLTDDVGRPQHLTQDGTRLLLTDHE
ncbi:MAG: Na+/H+ antiporter NhaA, partial [Pirellulales bacterium]|nr:Na+/H+ antiporter NhaA [Pirellulales bacterium]